ncbi:MAG: TIGR01459 family HAD-type hydrolase [Rhodospirillaceae bacterium]|nr:TIGR01459 family HAD-type hydrolase [Rhodospirillaceae bacterium]
MNQIATHMPSGLGAIVDEVDLILMDLWGCMHDGIAAYPAARDCLHRLKERNIPVALLSNAPRRTEAVRPRLREMGIGDDLYAGFYTSGEEVWGHLARRDTDAYRALGRRTYAIFAEHDRVFFDGLDLALVEDVAAADFLLAIGVSGPAVTVADFDAVLAGARARDLPLVCANPDLVVHRGGVAEICAGALAEDYRRRGGRIVIEGKPYPDIYRRVMADFGVTEPGRVLGIGDALRTDVAGAAGIGARSLLIAGGIHHGELLRSGEVDATALARLSEVGPRPDFALPYLRW